MFIGDLAPEKESKVDGDKPWADPDFDQGPNVDVKWQRSILDLLIVTLFWERALYLALLWISGSSRPNIPDLINKYI